MSLSSRWEKTRIRFFRSRIDNLIDGQQWQRALHAVIDFAQWADGRIDDRRLWLDMTVAATEIVAHLDDPAEYRAFLTHFADPFLGDGHRPHTEVLSAFADIADRVDPSVIIGIGRWLADARPDWPLGPYLIGHFRELRHRSGDEPGAIDETATFFRLAAERAERIDDDRWRLHTELRRGALLLSGGSDRQRGRNILGGLDWTGLDATDQLWMALALSGSDRWTDRMRSMDIVLDLHRAVASSRPEASDVRPRRLRATAAAIFRRAGLDLAEPESRRLDELKDALFDGAERNRWNEYLEARRDLSHIADLPFEQFDRVFASLDELANTHPDRWAPVARRFRILASGWSGDYRSTDEVPTVRTTHERLPVADAVARILSFLDDADSRSGGADFEVRWRSHLVDLDRALGVVDDQRDGAAARPVALFWSRLVDNSEHLCLDSTEELIASVADHYAALAPAPSYGWWTLAAHLFDAGLDDPALVVARRAKSSTDLPGDEPHHRYVANCAFARAVDNRDHHAARQWLEHL